MNSIARWRLIAVLGIALLPGPAARAQIIAGPIQNPANGHTYYLLAALTWTESQAQAVSLGGNLATINDAAENTWVTSQFSNFGGPKALWIGLNDLASEGSFEWVSGEPVTYTNWGPSEPNNHMGIEHTAQIFPPTDARFPRWNDAPDVLNPFGTPTSGIVEINSVPEPGAFTLTALTASGVLAWRRWRMSPRRQRAAAQHRRVLD